MEAVDWWIEKKNLGINSLGTNSSLVTTWMSLVDFASENWTLYLQNKSNCVFLLEPNCIDICGALAQPDIQ